MCSLGRIRRAGRRAVKPRAILPLMDFILEFSEAALFVLVLAVVALEAANTYFKTRISRALMDHETPFTLSSFDYRTTMLVLGDSTGVGVGADKAEHTVAGRLAKHVGATYVENYAASGTETAELGEQIKKAKLPRYDYVLIHTGGNDILAFHNPKKTARELGQILAELPQAGKVIVLSAGNVGGSTIFPHVIRPVYTALNLRFHKEFGRICHAYNAVYVNLFEPFWRDPFLRDPRRYLSRDGLHPSLYGYGLWFEKVRDALS
jgi:lysophospholipase L1-like esterase